MFIYFYFYYFNFTFLFFGFYLFLFGLLGNDGGGKGDDIMAINENAFKSEEAQKAVQSTISNSSNPISVMGNIEFEKVDLIEKITGAIDNGSV
jgi:hypothetical protein